MKNIMIFHMRDREILSDTWAPLPCKKNPRSHFEMVKREFCVLLNANIRCACCIALEFEGVSNSATTCTRSKSDVTLSKMWILGIWLIVKIPPLRPKKKNFQSHVHHPIPICTI